MTETLHTPVLLREVLTLLDPKRGQVWLDGTVGLGGHAAAICKLIAPDGRLMAIDRDPTNLARARERLTDGPCAVTFAHGSYQEAKKILYDEGINLVDAILLDLGFASTHVDDPRRGFSFQSDGPLDMRYDTTGGTTAAEVVNQWTDDELTRMFRSLGEEPNARRIAKAIVVARKKHEIATTGELAEIISVVCPRRGKIHPATRVFQALRLAVNDELGHLAQALPDLLSLLRAEGRMGVISFHSLEDRIVKQFMRRMVESGAAISLTKKPVVPTEEECRSNPRARSAKLRVIQRYDPSDITTGMADAMGNAHASVRHRGTRRVVHRAGERRRGDRVSSQGRGDAD